jgi:hypothetical protein
MKCYLGAILFVSAISPALAQVDHGGSIGERAQFINQRNIEYARDPSLPPFHLRGVLTSAATMELGIKKVCIEQNAVLMFHYERKSPQIISQRALFEAEVKHFPRLYEHVRAWFRTPVLRALYAPEAIALGVPPCRE